LLLIKKFLKTLIINVKSNLSLAMNPHFKHFIVKALAVYFILLAGYFIVWSLIFTGIVPLSFSQSSEYSTLSSTTTNQPLHFQTSVDVKIFRYGFIPVYWSKIGDLTTYHQIFFSVITLELAVFSILKYKRTAGFPKQKILKPKSAIPIIHGDGKMPKTKKNRFYSRIILTVWAFIGFSWFVLYQLLPALPFETSLVIVELMNFASWIMFFVTIAYLLLPYLKTVYHKIWEGG